MWQPSNIACVQTQLLTLGLIALNIAIINKMMKRFKNMSFKMMGISKKNHICVVNIRLYFEEKNYIRLKSKTKLLIVPKLMSND